MPSVRNHHPHNPAPAGDGALGISTRLRPGKPPFAKESNRSQKVCYGLISFARGNATKRESTRRQRKQDQLLSVWGNGWGNRIKRQWSSNIVEMQSEAQYAGTRLTSARAGSTSTGSAHVMSQWNHLRPLARSTSIKCERKAHLN